MSGNVETVPALPDSGAEYQITHSLFYLATKDGSPADSAIIQNNGVNPDIDCDYGFYDFKEGSNTLSSRPDHLRQNPRHL